MRNWITLLEDHDRDHADALEQTGFWGSRGAGCLVLAQSTGRLLVALRSQHVLEPGMYGTWGGAVDSHEQPRVAVLRELREETDYSGDIVEVIPLYIFRSGSFEYHNFLIVVPDEFIPELDWENDGFTWCEYGDWPQPLHFGLRDLLKDSHSNQVICDNITR